MTLLTTLFEQKVKPKFRSLEAMLVETSAAVRPPERLSVSESAQKYRYIDGLKWDNSTAPYLKEPMDMLGSLDHTGMVLVGPARCGKSEVGLNWLNHSALCDPADMMIVHMKRDSARDWSNKELQKFINQNAKIREQLLDRNTHDLRFRNGMDLLIKWPTILKGGVWVLIEAKKFGDDARIQQQREHQRLRAKGANVYVVDNLEEGKRVLDAHDPDSI